MNIAEIREAIIELDDSMLALEQLQSLKTILPSNQDLNLIRDYLASMGIANSTAVDDPEFTRLKSKLDRFYTF